MQYSKARIYSPTLGRFLQTDPIDVEGGISLYAYVGNDPVNWVDPSGLSCVAVGNHACPANDPDITIIGTRPVSDWVTIAGFRIIETLINWGGGSGGGGPPKPQSKKSCGTGARIKISPFGFGVTGFLFIGGFSGNAEGGISIPLTALKGNFRGTQLYASGSVTQLLGIGAFVGAGNNFGTGYTSGPIRTGATSFSGGPGGTPSPVVQGGAAWMAGGESQVELGSSPGIGGGGGPRAGFGAYAAGGIKHSATAATPELCY